MSGRKTRRPGEIAIPPGSGLGKGHTCTGWPRPGDSSLCTLRPAIWGCRACHSYGRPFYGHDELQFLEHGTGPLAAELARLWRARGPMKDRPARGGADDEIAGWRAGPPGAARLGSRRRSFRTVTDLYYPGLQDRPPVRDKPNDGRGS